MKRFFRLMLLFVVISVSCSPIEVPDTENSDTKGVVYTVNANMGIKGLDAKYGTNSTVNIAFFEYNDKDEMVNNHTWYNVKDNATKRITAHKLATKMVALIEMDSYVPATGKMFEYNQYVAQVFYLENNMQITIDSNTRVSDYHPLK